MALIPPLYKFQTALNLDLDTIFLQSSGVEVNFSDVIPPVKMRPES